MILTHDIEFVSTDPLFPGICTTERRLVNSLHHQALARFDSEVIRPVAVSADADRYVEAFRVWHRGRPRKVRGLQFHIEKPTQPNIPLLRRFLELAG